MGEVAGNLNGGYNDDKTARYSDQFALGAHLDLQKIFGWHDAEFKLAITERSGRNLSNDRISDPRAGQFSSVRVPPQSPVIHFDSLEKASAACTPLLPTMARRASEPKVLMRLRCSIPLRPLFLIDGIDDSTALEVSHVVLQ